MKQFSFRIRRRYFDQIVSAEKQIEYRRDSPFWRARLGDIYDEKAIAVFICGKRVHRRWILSVRLMLTPETFSEQGKQDVDTTHCWAIRLGAEITPEEYEQLLEKPERLYLPQPEAA